LVFHYTKGLEFYVKRFQYFLDWVIQNFSFIILIKTLFAPWKRLVVTDRRPGFDFKRFFETLSFNLISRGIGAIVRVFLICVGFILLILVFLLGIFGLFLWILLPFLSIPYYLKYIKTPQRQVQKILSRIYASGDRQVSALFDNEAGKFVLEHTGVTLTDVKEIKTVKEVKLESPTSYKDLITRFIDAGVFSEEFFRKKEVAKDDFINAAGAWDKERLKETQIGETSIKRPGWGLELLFGYTPYLNQYASDLATPQAFFHHLIGREEVVARMERALTSGASICLVGEAGVGKKTVALEFAKKAAEGALGPKMAFRRVLEFDYNFLLAESGDLNFKKSRLSEILTEASGAGNIILVVRDIQRLTNADVEGYDFTDIFEEHLEKGELKIIAISTPHEYEKLILPNTRLRKFMEKIEVAEVSEGVAMEILLEAGRTWEKTKKLVITVPALRKILEGSEKYISDTPFPEKALELLDAVVIFKEKTGGGTVEVADVGKILEEKTGISFAVIDEKEKLKLINLEEIIHERLINQEAAVTLIAKSLRARTVGVAKEGKPVGSFLFLGPTGVGKTETAKVLAKVYFGSSEEITRFDMSEYSGQDALERLIGSVVSKEPGRLSSAIKNKPASLLLLDELEKAKPEVYNLLLTMLDEGYFTDSFGKKINCRHLFIIGTSNAGAEHIRKLVKGGERGLTLQKSLVEYVLSNHIFSPELINRFDGVVVYEPLNKEHLIKIAALMLSELKETLKKKGVDLMVESQVAEKLAQDGYDPAFGARPMRRIIDLVLGDLIGKAILAGEIKEGDKIKITPGAEKEEFSWEKVENT